MARTFSSAKPMPFGGLTVVGIRVIRNCTSNSLCNTHWLAKHIGKELVKIDYVELKVRVIRG